MSKFSWKRFWNLPALTIALTVCFDQWTKSIIVNVEALDIGGRIEVIPNLFHIVHVKNTGAAWGILPNATPLLAVISAIAFIVLLIYYPQLAAGFTERGIAVSVMMGGIAGNLIDRVWRNAVVDFLSFTYKSFEWPSFNVADSAICTGVVLYSISSLIRTDEVQRGTAPSSQS